MAKSENDPALTEKSRGNECMKVKDFSKAIEHYSRAVSINPRESTLFCNRALAYLKQRKPSKALEDCSTAIDLDKNYVKPYYRRALAQQILGRFTAAQHDLEKTLALDPTNKEARKELLGIRNKRQPNGTIKITRCSQVPDAVSSQPLERIPIHSIKSPVLTSLKSDLAHNNEAVDNVLQSTSSEDMEESNSGVEDREQLDTTLPQTSFELLSAWKRYRTNADDLFKFFMMLPVQDYCRLFDEFLDGDMLSEIIVILSKISFPKQALERLVALSTVPRIEMAAMFLTANEKNQLLCVLREADSTNDDESLIRAAFEID